MELTLVKEVAERAVQNLAVESDSRTKFDCANCADTGFITEPYESDGRQYTRAKSCECAIRKYLNRIVPVEYHSVALELLRPRTDRHWRQADLVAQIQKAPNESYVFSGDFGTGKSHFFWALCVEAVRARKKLFAGTLKALVNHYHESIEASRRGEIYLLPIYPDDFRGKDQCALFLDDLDKARPTEFVVEQLFELLDAAVSNKHQIVVTTNLSPDALITHFERADTTGRFGGSIVRRLLHNSTLIDMF